MKKVLLATLVAGLGVGSVQAAPTVYGKLDASVDFVDKQKPTKDTVQVNANNSLFGVKGEEKLTDSLSVLYLIEWQVSSDGDDISGVTSTDGKTNGNKLDLAQRNRYIGLKHDKLGSIKIGKNDTYVKRLGSIDLFDNYVANAVDIQNTITGENRLDNTISYETPNIKLLGGDFQFNTLVAAGEDNTSDSAVSNGKASGHGLADAISSSVTYKNDNAGIWTGIAYDKSVPSRWLAVDNGVFAETNTVRAIANYTIKPAGLSLRAIVQRAEVDESKTASSSASIAKLDKVNNETGFILGAAYTIPGYDKVTVKAQYNQSKTSFKGNAYKDFDLDQIALGVDYAFNSRTRAYSYLAQYNKDDGAKDTKTRYGGVGLEYKF